MSWHRYRREMSIRKAFWRYAHDRYHSRVPSRIVEWAAFAWGVFFVLVYSGALLRNWRPTLVELLLGAILVGSSWLFWVTHRLIRLERRKGPNALYQKYVDSVLRAEQ